MEEKFYAKIYVTNFPQPITVEVMARHTEEAKKRLKLNMQALLNVGI